MFQLHKCNVKEFCGNMRADYYFTYYQCSCPHGLMCLQKDHETYNVSELLYTGSAYRAICSPNWSRPGHFPWSFNYKTFKKCSVYIHTMKQRSSRTLLTWINSDKIKTEHISWWFSHCIIKCNDQNKHNYNFTHFICGCTTWSLTLRKKHWGEMFRLFGRKRKYSEICLCRPPMVPLKRVNLEKTHVLKFPTLCS